MRLISLVHRWTGAFLGLLLALLGLSGALLVWEGDWIAVPGSGDPLAADARMIAEAAGAAAEAGTVSRITFASEEIGLHHVAFSDGGGAYLSQAGEVVERWNSQWERPELWLFDFHHHLFAGDTGEIVTGIAGLAGLAFVVTGTILWWRSRKRFNLRLWPERMAPGPIVKHHRDLGLVAAPLLILSLGTGVLMLFEPLREMVLGVEERPRVEADGPATAALDPVEGAILSSAARFPDARLRRITLPGEPGDPIRIRMKQAEEWTPNGRTQLSFDAGTGQLLSVEDALQANKAAWFSEKLYPLHSAKVGGLALKVAMTVSGLVLTVLGLLTTYSFWKRRGGARRRGASFPNTGRPLTDTGHLGS